MKAYKRECIPEIIDNLLSKLEQEGLSAQTITSYRCGFSLFQRYIADVNAEIINEEVALDYIEKQTGKRFNGLHEKTGDAGISRRNRPLFFLLNHEDEGFSCHTSHRSTPLFFCPEGWSNEYEGYLFSLEERELHRSTIDDRKKGASNFIKYLADKGLEYSDQVSPEHVDAYLLQFKDKSIKTRAATISMVKDFLGYLFEHEYSTSDLRFCIPKLKVPRSTGKQHLWTRSRMTSISPKSHFGFAGNHPS